MERTVGRDGGKSRTQVNKEMREGPKHCTAQHWCFQTQLLTSALPSAGREETEHSPPHTNAVSEFEMDFLSSKEVKICCT